MHRDIDAFTRGCIECALWAINDESTAPGGEPMDKNYNWAHIADESLAKIIADCANFQNSQKGLLALAGNESQNGHDFFLTRNHHGSGFWDRGYEGDTGEKLTNAAHDAGGMDLYIGDDGKIYCS